MVGVVKCILDVAKQGVDPPKVRVSEIGHAAVGGNGRVGAVGMLCASQLAEQFQGLDLFRTSHCRIDPFRVWPLADGHRHSGVANAHFC